MTNEQSKKPIVIAIGGLSGSGKSTLTRNLIAHYTGTQTLTEITSDKVRKDLLGVSYETTLPDEAYSKEQSDKTYAEMDRRIKSALDAGDILIVEIVFANEKGRQKIQEIAEEHGAEFHGVWLDLAYEDLKERVANRTNDVSDAGVEIVDLQQTFNLGEITWDRVNASQTPYKVYDDARQIIDLDVFGPSDHLDSVQTPQKKLNI